MSDTQSPATGRPDRRSIRRVALASVAGTTLEFYDFTIYGLASALVFSKVFFPNTSPTVGLLASFATFGVGFAARPLGGVLFGHLGDRIGRKKILVATLLIMGGATVLIGCLPGYATIGLWAPILLVVLRLVQGLAYGGEWGGAVLMTFEHVPPSRRGFYTSLPQAGISAGSLLGNVAFLAVALLPEDQLLSWGWRIPFWAGALLLVLGLVIRRRIEESPAFQRNLSEKNIAKSPALDVIRTHPRQILLAGGAMLGISAAAYVTITYSLSYATQAGISRSFLLTAILVSNALQLILIPLSGALSDRYGRSAVFVVGALVWAALAAGFFPMLGSGSLAIAFLAYLLPYGVGYAITQGATPAMLAEAFASRVGYSGISMGSQLGNMLGGFSPFLAVLVVGAFGVNVLGFSITVLLILSGVCAAALTRISRSRASDDDQVERPLTDTGAA